MDKVYTFTKSNIKSDNVISVPVIPFNPNTGRPAFDPSNICLAIWDTGCSHTTISESLAKKLNLVSHSEEEKLFGGLGVYENSKKYYISFEFENGLLIENYEVLSTPMVNPPIEILIGMDIIGKGDFTITNRDDQIVFSFLYPSQSEIDFINE